jgi:hypothetical protein
MPLLLTLASPESAVNVPAQFIGVLTLVLPMNDNDFRLGELATLFQLIDPAQRGAAVGPENDLIAQAHAPFKPFDTRFETAVHFGLLASKAAMRASSSPISIAFPAPSMSRMTLPASSGVTLPSATACKSPSGDKLAFAGVFTWMRGNQHGRPPGKFGQGPQLLGIIQNLRVGVKLVSCRSGLKRIPKNRLESAQLHGGRIKLRDNFLER